MASIYLAKIERFLRTDLSYIFNNGPWLLLAQGIASISSLLLAIAFAHFISQEVYGTYKYVLTVASFITAFSLTGTGTSLVRSIANGKDGSMPFLFRKKLLWATPVVVIGLSLSGYYYTQENLVLAFGMLFAGLLTPLIESASLYSAFLQGKKEFRRSVIYKAIRSVLPAVIIFLVIYSTTDVYWIITAYFVSTTLTALFLYQTVKTRFTENTEIDHSILSYSKHLSFLNILTKTATALDKFLIFHFLGAAQLAVYTFAVLVPKEIMALTKKISVLAMPKFAQRSTEEIRVSITRKTLLFSLTLVPIVFGYYFLSPYLYKYLFPAYIESIPYSQVFIFAILATINIPVTVFESQKLLKENYIIKITSSIIRIVLMCILFFPFGLWGLIIGRLIARFLTYGLGLWLVRRIN